MKKPWLDISSTTDGQSQLFWTWQCSVSLAMGACVSLVFLWKPKSTVLCLPWGRLFSCFQVHESVVNIKAFIQKQKHFNGLMFHVYI